MTFRDILRPRGRLGSTQHTRIAAIFLVLAVCGCTGVSGDAGLRDALAAEANDLARALSAGGSEAAADALRVRLGFGDRADLDLYVTDPTQETAYFANSPTRLGARLERDVRCESPAPRIETLTLADPLPGRYRVGVDYPQPCGDDRGPVAFVVYFDANGRRATRRGSIAPGQFLAIALEVDVE